MDFIGELILDNLALTFLSAGLLLYIVLHKEQRLNSGIVIGLIGICLALGVATTMDRILTQYSENLLEEVWSKGYVTISDYLAARGEVSHGTFYHHIVGAFDYSLRPATVMMLWLMTRSEVQGKTFFFIIPCVANALLAFTSYFSHWAFYYEEVNHAFCYGPLYFWAFLTSLFYAGLLVLEAISRYQQHLNRELIFIVFLLLSYGIIAAVESIFTEFTGTVLNVVIIGFVIFYYLFLQTKELEVALAEQEISLTDKENSLKLSQIKPHFIFNTLTSIIDLCPEDSDAQKALIAFARYLRTNTDSVGSKRKITFDEELNNAKVFIELEKYSYGDRLKVDYFIGPTDFLIPPLSLQPLVENSVKYCFKAHETAQIIIWTTQTDSSYIICVEDDGPGYDGVTKVRASLSGSAKSREHVGVENIRYRLHEISGASLEYKRRENGGTKATIIIPKEITDENIVG